LKMAATIVTDAGDLAKANLALRLFLRHFLDSIPWAVAGMDEVLRDEAKKIAPVGTPESTGKPNYIVSEAYKRSIRAKRSRVKRVGNVFKGGVTAGGYVVNPNTGVPVDYALVNPRSWRRGDVRGIEFGFSHQAPVGVLIPAAHRSKHKMRVKAVKRLNRRIKRFRATAVMR